MRNLRAELVYNNVRIRDDIREKFLGKLMNRIDKYFEDKSCDVSSSHVFSIGLMRELKK